jgi:hypothetical protein
MGEYRRDCNTFLRKAQQLARRPRVTPGADKRPFRGDLSGPGRGQFVQEIVMVAIESCDRIAYIKHRLPNRDMPDGFWTSVYTPQAAGVQASAGGKLRDLRRFCGHPSSGRCQPEDLDVDARSIVDEWLDVGPVDGRAGQQGLIQRVELGSLEGVGRVVDLTASEVPPKGRI